MPQYFFKLKGYAEFTKLVEAKNYAEATRLVEELDPLEDSDGLQLVKFEDYEYDLDEV